MNETVKSQEKSRAEKPVKESYAKAPEKVDFTKVGYTNAFRVIREKLGEKYTGLILAYVTKSEGMGKGNYQNYERRQSENLARRLFTISEWILSEQPEQKDKTRYLKDRLDKANKWWIERQKKKLPENYVGESLRAVIEEVFRKKEFSDDALVTICKSAEWTFVTAKDISEKNIYAQYPVLMNVLESSVKDKKYF